MVEFTATIMKFDQQAEKTGWSYILIPSEVASRLNTGSKKAFRVRGRLDDYAIEKTALLPMGNGDFILPVNAMMRRALKKVKGAKVRVVLEKDDSVLQPPADFMDCLSDEPQALKFYESLTKAQKNYFAKWIGQAKTEGTRARRIAMAVNALARGWGFSEMLRGMREEKTLL